MDCGYYIDAFNSRLKTKAFEQFSLLLCDLEKSNDQQLSLLHSLLEDHRSLQKWAQYITYVSARHPDRKFQLQRLINKALEFLDENELNGKEEFLDIHLYSVKLKR